MENQEYLTSNSNIAWPFSADNPNLNRVVARLFADGGAFLDLDEVDNGATVSNLVLSDTGVLSFIVSKQGKHQVSAAVIADISAPGFKVAKGSWYFFVLDGYEASSLLADPDFSGLEEKQAMPLDATAMAPAANRITSITLKNHAPNPKGSDESVIKVESTYKVSLGEVKLRAGNNIHMISSTDGFVDSSLFESEAADPETVRNLFQSAAPLLESEMVGLAISAYPGLGSGVAPCQKKKPCEDKTGNLPKPVNGNITIEGDDCYAVVAEAGKLMIYGRCTPCCQCKDFEETGNRLAEQSREAKNAYDTLIKTAEDYNKVAGTFNADAARLEASGNEWFIVKCVAASQFVGSGETVGSLSLTDIAGSVDRGQGVITLVNASPYAAYVELSASMSPQTLARAVIIEPVSTSAGSVSTASRNVECQGSFQERIALPSGSSATVRVYGATPGSTAPSQDCRITGTAAFLWKAGNDSRSITKDFSASAS